MFPSIVNPCHLSLFVTYLHPQTPALALPRAAQQKGRSEQPYLLTYGLSTFLFKWHQRETTVARCHDNYSRGTKLHDEELNRAKRPCYLSNTITYDQVMHIGGCGCRDRTPAPGKTSTDWPPMGDATLFLGHLSRLAAMPASTSTITPLSSPLMG